MKNLLLSVLKLTVALEVAMLVIGIYAIIKVIF